MGSRPIFQKEPAGTGWTQPAVGLGASLSDAGSCRISVWGLHQRSSLLEVADAGPLASCSLVWLSARQGDQHLPPRRTEVLGNVRSQ